MEQKLEQARSYLNAPNVDAAQADKNAAPKPPTVTAESASKAEEKTQASSQPVSPPVAKPVEEKKFPPAIPTINMNLQFKPMHEITQVNHYIKFIPSVYDNNNLYFDWHETLYEINNNDRRFLAQLNTMIEQGTIGGASGQQPLDEHDLERVFDILEKIFFVKKELTDVVLLSNFRICAEHALQTKVSEQVMKQKIIPYWKAGRNQKKRKSFIRKFWENPDWEDKDPNAAFRQKAKQKGMITRPKHNQLQQKLKKRHAVIKETKQYILKELIPQVWRREANKQILDRVHDAKFDLMYEKMLKEKGLQPK